MINCQSPSTVIANHAAHIDYLKKSLRRARQRLYRLELASRKSQDRWNHIDYARGKHEGECIGLRKAIIEIDKILRSTP